MAGVSGIRAYRRARPVLLGLAASASLFGAARAAEGDADEDAAAATVSAVTVTGEMRPLGQDTGLSVLSTRVQDTPQAISRIGADQLKAQGVTSLEGALRNVPGITIAIGEGGTLSGDQFKIRGFDAKDDVYLDGLRDFGAYTRDSFADEEVQVLKGPSGALFGRGAAGGAINVISKAPRRSDFATVDAYVGDGAYGRALADINHRFGDAAALRLSLMATSTGVVGRDLIYSRRWGAAVAGGWGLGTDSAFTLAYRHQHNHQRPDYGITIVQPPGQIVALPATEYGVGVSRSAFLGYRDDVDRSDTDMLTARFAHRFNDKVSLTSDTRYAVYSRYFQYSTLDQCAAACTAALFDNNPSTEPLGGNGGQGPYDMDAWGLQSLTTLKVNGDLGPFRSQAVFSIDLSRQVNDKTIFAYGLPAGFATRQAIPRPLVHADPNLPPGYFVFGAIPGRTIACPSATANCTTVVNGTTVFTNTLGSAIAQSRGAANDAGLFVSDRLWFTDSLSIMASDRVDLYEARLDAMTFAGQASSLKVKPVLHSPRASLVWTPRADQTFYVSWGRSQTPQGTSVVGAATALSVTAKDLAPETSRIWEAGAKAGVPGTRLAATLSVFDVRKDNALQTDPATGVLQAQSGERQAVRGLELGLTGKITPAWTVSAGYAYLDDRIEQAFVNCVVPTSTTGVPANVVCPAGVSAPVPVLNTVATWRQAAFVPRTSASLFTTFDFDAWVRGLSAGGDAIYRSKLFLAYGARSASFTDRSTLTASRIAEQPASLTFDAFVAYRIGAYRLALNAYNLANRLNYAQSFGTRATPAPGRTLVLSLGASF